MPELDFPAFLSLFACRFSFGLLEAAVLEFLPPLSLLAMMAPRRSRGDRLRPTVSHPVDPRRQRSGLLIAVGWSVLAIAAHGLSPRSEAPRR